MAWIPAIASVAASLLSSKGQEDTNATNLQIQQNNSAFNAEQASLNRDWSANQAEINRDYQTDMANTTWQRGVRDMQSAGLNPMLAYSQGGNPAAAGAMGQSSAATAGQPGNAQNPWAAAGQSATQWATIENIQADTEKKKEEAELTRRQHLGYTGEQEVRVDKMRKEAELVIHQTNLSEAQRKKVLTEVDQVLAHIQNLDADTAVKKVNEVLQRNDVPRMEAEAAYFKTPVGKTSPHNKYGPQTPFRLLEGLGERVINKFSAAPARDSPPGYNHEDYRPAIHPGTHEGQYSWGRIQR